MLFITATAPRDDTKKGSNRTEYLVTEAIAVYIPPNTERLDQAKATVNASNEWLKT